MSGIYIHIPFCRQACSYCDFYFVTRDRLIPEFVDALICEVNAVTVHGGSPFPSDPVRTLYIGGGTPSRLSATHIRRLFAALHERIDLSQLEECTIEVNPEDVSPDWLSEVRDMGATRLSMGIQSFQPELLDFMHRAHSADQAHRALENVKAAGFATYSVDLIYGCPDQTTAQLQADLDHLMTYRPPHISAYSLTIEPKTRLGKRAALGRLAPAGDDDVATQAQMIRDTLAAGGIFRYEISNYSEPGHEALHNSAYWSHENYLGLGPAAHSFFWKAGSDYASRWQHPPDIHAYSRTVRSPNYRAGAPDAISGTPSHQIQAHQTLSHESQTPGTLPRMMRPGEKRSPETLPQKTQSHETISLETLSLETLAEERLMTGLRTIRGVDPGELQSRYRYSLQPSQRRQIDEFRKKGLLEPEDPLRLTKDGFQLADAITLRLI